MSEVAVELERRMDREFVPATLHTELLPANLALLEHEWRPCRDAVRQKLEQAKIPHDAWPQSLHWNWHTKEDYLKLLEVRCFGVQCDGQWQAAMMTRDATRFSQLRESKNKPLVYIEYLETAPWNWTVKPINQLGVFRGLGRLLFRQALVQSIQAGFVGRIGLHALPQAESFYVALGAKRVSFDKTKRLPYYELGSDQAKELLDQEGGAS